MGKVIPILINLAVGTTSQELNNNIIYYYANVFVYSRVGNLIDDNYLLPTRYILHQINKDEVVIDEILISVSDDVTGDIVIDVSAVQNVVSYLAGEDVSLNKKALDKNLDDPLTMDQLNSFINMFREQNCQVLILLMIPHSFLPRE